MQPGKEIRTCRNESRTRGRTSESELSLPCEAVSTAEFKAGFLRDLADNPLQLMQESAHLLYSMDLADCNLGQIGLHRAFQVLLREEQFAACCGCIQSFESGLRSQNFCFEESCDGYQPVAVQANTLVAKIRLGAGRGLEELDLSPMAFKLLAETNLSFLAKQEASSDLAETALSELRRRSEPPRYRSASTHPDGLVGCIGHEALSLQVSSRPENRASGESSDQPWGVTVTILDGSLERSKCTVLKREVTELDDTTVMLLTQHLISEASRMVLEESSVREIAGAFERWLDSYQE